MSKVFKLKNGSVLVSAEAPGGLYNSAQLRKIADLCDAEDAVVKSTEDQRLALFVKEDQLEAIAVDLADTGMETRNFLSGLHQPLSCIGEQCPDHEQDALSTAIDLTEALAEITLDSPLRIGINGCATCCVPCHTLDISVIGDMNGYRISLGGKNTQIPEMASFVAEGVPASEVVERIKNLIDIYREKAEPEESLHELIERNGATDFIKALAPYSQDAADESDPFGELTTGPNSESESETPSADEPETDAGLPGGVNLDDLPEADELNSEESAVEEEIGEDDDASDDEMLDTDLSIDDELNGTAPDINPSEEDEPEQLPDEVPIELNDSEEDIDPIAVAEDDIDPESENHLPDESSEDSLGDLSGNDLEMGLEDDQLDDDVSLSLAADELEKVNAEGATVDTEIDDELEGLETAVDLPDDQSLSQLSQAATETVESSTVSQQAEDSLDLDSSDDDELDEAEAMSEEEEIAFEDKIDASIEEQKQLAEMGVDENEAERDEALDLIGTRQDSSSSKDDIELLDDSELADSDLQMETYADISNVDDSFEDDSYRDDFNTANSQSENVSQLTSASSSSEISGLSLQDSKISFSFGSGANVSFSLERLRDLGGQREMTVDDKLITVKLTDAGIHVDVDGIEAFLPNSDQSSAA